MVLDRSAILRRAPGWKVGREAVSCRHDMWPWLGLGHDQVGLERPFQHANADRSTREGRSFALRDDSALEVRHRSVAFAAIAAFAALTALGVAINLKS